MKNQSKFTYQEIKVLKEIVRRRNQFDKDMIMALLCYPSEAKSLVQKGVLKPYSTETPRCLSWYNLTKLGLNELIKAIKSNPNLTE